MNKGRVVVAMSGGVDSSVAAHLLVEQGYDLVGLFMRTGAHVEADATCATGPNKIRGCCSAIDAADAQRVADRLNVPFYALNFAREFERIKDYFADEYFRGRTPNPCVVCNTWLKFGKLWDYAQSIGADFIATGHYARAVRCGDRHTRLERAADATKDQTYFLFGLQKDLLNRVLFPLGDLQKSDVRALADRHDLGVQHKPESQEICFVPSGNYQDFLREHRPNIRGAAGAVVDETGRVVASHAGIDGFTIGQRKGLGVALGEPRYVLSLDAMENRVVIGPRELLLRDRLTAERVNWLTPKPAEPVRATVKIRYLHAGVAATVTPTEQDSAEVRFDEPQSAITPGQAAVFYVGRQVIGGGWIADAP